MLPNHPEIRSPELAPGATLLLKTPLLIATLLTATLLTATLLITNCAIPDLRAAETNEKIPVWKTTNWQTLHPTDVAKTWPADKSAAFPDTWVITPWQPVVVRQNHPAPQKPSYQEADGTTLMLFWPKYPRLAQLASGRLVLRVATGPEERFVLMFSDDDGQTWSQPLNDPAPLTKRGQLAPLGGNELMCYGPTIYFSQDGGQTWPESVEVPATKYGKPWYAKGTILVEGDEVTAIQIVIAEQNKRISVLHRSPDRGRTWQERVEVPFMPSEGSLARASDGSLVAALRTSFCESEDYFPTKGIPMLNDHWRGITTQRSTDNGQTWSEPYVLARYGHHHQELLPLNNGSLLMTYHGRIGELDGKTYHGIEGVLSHDHGQTWDWQNRFIIFRWLPGEGVHSPISVQLADGRILTVFQHDEAGRYNRNGAAGRANIGRVSMVIWSADQAQR